jgi:hypothetical protein
LKEKVKEERNIIRDLDLYSSFKAYDTTSACGKSCWSVCVEGGSYSSGGNLYEPMQFPVPTVQRKPCIVKAGDFVIAAALKVLLLDSNNNCSDHSKCITECSNITTSCYFHLPVIEVFHTIAVDTIIVVLPDLTKNGLVMYKNSQS